MNLAVEDANVISQRDTRSPRTVIPNGPRIEAYRKARAWTREEFEWQSHLAVERAALDDSSDRRFLRRYKSQIAEGRLAGIGTTTLTNVESSKPVYVFTLKIVAETLGVSVKSLIIDGDRNDGTIEELFRILQTTPPPATADQQAKVLRAVLDWIYPK